MEIFGSLSSSSETSSSVFICRYCDDILDGAEELRDHERREHLDILPGNNSSSESEVSSFVIVTSTSTALLEVKEKPPEEMRILDLTDCEDEDSIVDLLDSPPSKRERRTSNSSDVTVACDESLRIDVKMPNTPEKADISKQVDPAEVSRLKIISTIDEIRDMIQRMVESSDSNNNNINRSPRENVEELDKEHIENPPSNVTDDMKGNSKDKGNLDSQLEGKIVTETAEVNKEIVNCEGGSLKETLQGNQPDDDRNCSFADLLLVSDATQSLPPVSASDSVENPMSDGNVCQNLASISDSYPNLSSVSDAGQSQNLHLARILESSTKSQEVQQYHSCTQCLATFNSEKAVLDHVDVCLFKNINFESVLSSIPETTFTVINLAGNDLNLTENLARSDLNLEQPAPLEGSVDITEISPTHFEDPCSQSSSQSLTVIPLEMENTAALAQIFPELEETSHTSLQINDVSSSSSPSLNVNSYAIEGKETEAADVIEGVDTHAADTIEDMDTEAADVIESMDTEAADATIATANPNEEGRNSSDETDTPIIIVNVTGNFLPSLINKTPEDEQIEANQDIDLGSFEISNPYSALEALQVPPAPSYDCPICGKVSQNLGDLQKHLTTHAEKFRCQKCKKVLKSLAGLKLHVNRIHGNEAIASSASKKSNTDNRRTKEPVVLEKHMETNRIHGNEAIASSASKKSNTGNRHTKEPVVREKKSKEMKCELCPKVLYSVSSYVLHLKAFHRMDQFTLDAASENSLSSDSFPTLPTPPTVVDILGDGLYRFRCDQCPATFGTETLLNHHLETFHGYTVLD